MDAKQLSDRLVDYLYGELDAEQQAAFDEALRAHPEVQHELLALQRTRGLLRDMEQIDPPARATDRLRQAAAAHVVTAPPEASWWQRVRAGLAVLIANPAVPATAMVVVVVGLSLYAYRLSGPPEQVATPARVAAEQAPLGSVSAASVDSPAATDEDEMGDRGGQLAKQEEPEDIETRRTDDVDHAGRSERRVVKAEDRPGKRSRTRRGAKRRARRARAAEPSVKKLMVDEHDALRVAGGQGSLGGRRGSATGAMASSRSRAGKAKGDMAASTPARKAPAGPADRNQVARSGAPAPAPALGSAYGTEGADVADDLDVEMAPAEVGAKGRGAAEQPATRREYVTPPPPRAKASESKQASSRRWQASQWVAQGSRAVASKDCPRALHWFNRALAADGRLVWDVERRLGRCAAALGRSAKTYPLLAKRMQWARQERARRARARDKAKAKPAAPAGSAPAEDK